MGTLFLVAESEQTSSLLWSVERAVLSHGIDSAALRSDEEDETSACATVREERAPPPPPPPPLPDSERLTPAPSHADSLYQPPPLPRRGWQEAAGWNL